LHHLYFPKTGTKISNQDLRQSQEENQQYEQTTTKEAFRNHVDKNESGD
jgi:hypothetical protein